MAWFQKKKNKPKDETVEKIRDYLKSDVRTGAVMLTGDWGGGKSFFIEHILQRKIWPCNFFTVSLFGVNSQEQFDKKVKEVYSPGKSKFFTVAGALSFTVLVTILLNGFEALFRTLFAYDVPEFKSIFNLDIIGTAEVAGSLGKLIGAILGFIALIIFAHHILKKPKPKSLFIKNVFVFDDFERASLDMKMVMGLISNLIDEGIKVIIVANENEISNDKKEDYGKFKEKIVFMTINYIADKRSVISAIVEETAEECRKLNILIYNLYFLCFMLAFCGATILLVYGFISKDITNTILGMSAVIAEAALREYFAKKGITIEKYAVAAAVVGGIMIGVLAGYAFGAAGIRPGEMGLLAAAEFVLIPFIFIKTHVSNLANTKYSLFLLSVTDPQIFESCNNFRLLKRIIALFKPIWKVLDGRGRGEQSFVNKEDSDEFNAFLLEYFISIAVKMQHDENKQDGSKPFHSYIMSNSFRSSVSENDSLKRDILRVKGMYDEKYSSKHEQVA
ncbi:MAG: hypothetical protein LBD16_03615 [Oscillospiraceae bacterium]|nr:hypothetical protein [Oscillospiraceae bacterium]